MVRSLCLTLVLWLGISGSVLAEPERVVSLAPALTRMMVDLGVSDRLVGVAEHDSAAPEGVAVVGSMMALDRERLIVVRPEVIVHMGVMGGAREQMEMVARRTGCRVEAFAYPADVSGVWSILSPGRAGGGDGLTVGRLMGCEAEAAALRERLEGRLEAVRERVAELERPRVLLVFGLEPVSASGPGTVLDEMVRIAGGRNALGKEGGPYQVLDRELLHEVAPEVVLMLLPGAAALKEDDARYEPWARSAVPAAESGRVWLLNDPEVLLPSTRLVDVVERMAALMHPEVFEKEEGEPDEVESEAAEPRGAR